MKASYKNVPVRASTYRRLQDYKMGDSTFDEVLNQLMDAFPIEVVAESVIREHKRRLKNFKGRDWREVRRALGDD